MVASAPRAFYRHDVPTLVAIAKRLDALNRAIARGVAWLLVAMILIGAFNAIARSQFPALASNAMLELQWYLFSLVFLLGAPYALRRGDHVRVDVLYGGLPARGRHWIDLIGGLLFLIPFCGFAIWASMPFVLDSWAEGEMSNDPGGLPRYPIKTAVPIAFSLVLLQGISEIIKRAALLRGASDEDVAVEEPREQN